jgi:hypothetical protein
VRGESRLESGVYLAKRRFCEVWLLSRGLFPLDNLVIGVF